MFADRLSGPTRRDIDIDGEVDIKGALSTPTVDTFAAESGKSHISFRLELGCKDATMRP
jgi:hypothetical protein